MSLFSNIAIVIPAYQPSEILIKLVDSLIETDYRAIVVINDGSDASKQPIFEALQQKKSVTVIALAKNIGKGNGIKTGLQFVLKTYPNILGVITVDADGQHLPEDVAKIATALIENPSSLVLGVRRFEQDVPLRSRFGNSLTRWLFRTRFKVDIQDTQTGLRGIPLELLPVILKIPYNNYEFEMECLIQAVKTKHPIQQIEIRTVYIDKNVASHFNPITDSVRIYYVFLRYSLIAFLSYVIDFTLFVLLYVISKKLFLSLLLARIASSLFNFYQNKFLVFRSNQLQTLRYQMVGYFSLATINFFISYFGILLVTALGVKVIPAKLLVDTLIFITLFIIQKKLIFKKD